MSQHPQNLSALAKILDNEYREFKQRFPELNFKADLDRGYEVGSLLANEMARQAGDFTPAIAESRRPYIGKAITILKKIIGRFWRPFSHVYLRPQMEFNQLTVTMAFRLASLESKLQKLELSLKDGKQKN